MSATDESGTLGGAPDGKHEQATAPQPWGSADAAAPDAGSGIGPWEVGRLDFFGDSPSPTLPVPSTPPTQSATVPPAASPSVTSPPAISVETAGGGCADGAGERHRRGVRIRTVVFGLVMLAISVAGLLDVLTSLRVDGAVIGLALLVGAGAALLLGGLAAALRDVRRGATAP